MIRSHVAILCFIVVAASCRTRDARPTPSSEETSSGPVVNVERAVSFQCNQCNILVYTGHRCGVSRPCHICNVETDPLKHRHNATKYCPNCIMESGVGHRCGETQYCYECNREAGKNHACRVTILCKNCRAESAPDHRCGLTVYCPDCRNDVGKNHTHGRTFWCKACVREVDREHNCPVGGPRK